MKAQNGKENHLRVDSAMDTGRLRENHVTANLKYYYNKFGEIRKICKSIKGLLYCNNTHTLMIFGDL